MEMIIGRASLYFVLITKRKFKKVVFSQYVIQLGIENENSMDYECLVK
jgi:hypothetical protein